LSWREQEYEMPRVNKDELVMIVRESVDGYFSHVFLYKARSPVAAVQRAEEALFGAIEDPSDPASANDREEMQVAADKTELKAELAAVVNDWLA
jgi:hypothetical protein